MRHVALTVAGWWITWALFGLVAWFGLALFILWAFRWLHSRDVAAGKAAAADDQPVPYWPTGKAVDAEWDRIVSALKEDW